MSKGQEGSEEDGEEELTLSAATFAALNEFYQEQDARDRERKEVLHAATTAPTAAEEEGFTAGLSIDFFSEDWQLSQFWYDKATAEALAEECLRAAGEGGRVACVSCPTLFLALRRLSPKMGERLRLFEFDRRFASSLGGQFVFYDYKSPLDIPRDLRENFDVVFADPPFLSEECLTKTAVTVKFLAKDKIVLCSGAVMEELAGRLLSLKVCEFVPRHRNNLANEFRCFANYDLDSFVTTTTTPPPPSS